MPTKDPPQGRAILRQLPGWMNYTLSIAGESKPRSIVWTNHNNSYIRFSGAYVPVVFSPSAFDNTNDIPMKLTNDNKWIMA